MSPEEEPRGGGSAKRFMANLALAGGSLLVFALLTEIALSLVIPLVYRPRVTRIDPVLGWTHNPSSVTGEMEGYPLQVTYNQLGYRAPERAFTNSDGATRVLLLGDSFVDGAEVSDSDLHTALMERGLNDTEVINLGVYGYSTAQELLTLQHVGLRFGPDVVVLLTISNDFVENVRNFTYFGPAPRYRLEADSLVFEPATGPTAQETFRETNLPAPFMRLLHRRSMLYYILNHRIYQRLEGERIGEVLQAQYDAVPEAERVELYRRLVLEMAEMSRQEGADFLLVFGYLRNQVVGRDSSPNEALVARLEADGLEVLDLFAGLKSAQQSSTTSLWYERDIHWNVAGHQVVADLIRPRVEEILSARDSLGG